MHFSLAELAERVGGRVDGDGSIRIERVMPLEDAGPVRRLLLREPQVRAPTSPPPGPAR